MDGNTVAIFKGFDYMSGEYWAIGLMTGTALDGYVDAALLRTDGENIIELGPYILSPYSEEDRKILADAVTIAREWNFNGVEPDILIQATNVIDKIYAQAVLKLISDANLKTKDIDYIGGHGLTALGQRVKQGTLADIRQANNSGAKHSPSF